MSLDTAGYFVNELAKSDLHVAVSIRFERAIDAFLDELAIAYALAPVYQDIGVDELANRFIQRLTDCVTDNATLEDVRVAIYAARYTRIPQRQPNYYSNKPGA